jgi:PAS domain S-box-containing protein
MVLDALATAVVTAAGLVALITGLVVQARRRSRAELRLRESEERYRAVIDAQHELIWRFRPDATLTFVNDAFCRVWGRQRADLIDSSFLDLLAPETREPVRAYIDAAVCGKTAQTRQQDVLLPGGEIRWHEWTEQPLVDPATGAVLEVQAVGRDITEQKLAEAALRENEARTSAILRALPDMMFVLTSDGYYVDFHARERGNLYVPPGQFLGRHIADVMPPDLAQRMVAALERAVSSSEPVIVEYTLPLLGEERHWEARLVADERGQIISIVRDMTEQRRFEHQLGQSERVLRAVRDRNDDLVGRLIASQENERRRIARELHDDVSQKLALLSMRIDQLQRDETNVPFRSAVRDVWRQSVDIATDIHDLSHRLHPSKLEALGLQSALETVCRETSQQHGLAIECEISGVPSDLDFDVSLCLYRIAQEALHNIVKHSDASHASVTVGRSGDELHLQVADQGAGFSPADAVGTGLGLVSIRERASALGGRVAISSTPGRGARIDVRVPMMIEARLRDAQTDLRSA